MHSLTDRMPRPAPAEAKWRLVTRDAIAERTETPVATERRQRFEVLAASLAPAELQPALRARVEARVQTLVAALAPERRSKLLAWRPAIRWRKVAPVAAGAWAIVLAAQAILTVLAFALSWVTLSAAHAAPDSFYRTSEVSATAHGVSYNVVPPAPPVEETPWLVWPVIGRISQPMWAGHPSGIDVAVDTGKPIHAIRDGKVVFAGGDACCEYGHYVVVLHDDGWTSLYGHFEAINVTNGQDVHQGDELGLSGNTGKSSGPHLHFELRSYGTPVDPLRYLAPP